MELDEVEQFFKAKEFKWGYWNEPPLYTWIVKIFSFMFGLNIYTLVATKYILIFLFFLTFYFICRKFWLSKEAMVITGTLLLFITYSYEFNRHLSNTVLLSLLAVITIYIFISLLENGKTIYYILMGISIGAGILSKYNFFLLIIALILTSLLTKKGRKLLFNTKIIFTFFFTILILLPHVIWLYHNNFQTFMHALNRLKSLSTNFFSFFIEALIYIIVFTLFFIRKSTINIINNQLKYIRLLSFYSFVSVALIFIVFFLIGYNNFSSKYLAPLYFTLPLTLFSIIKFDVKEKRCKIFIGLLISLIIVTFGIRLSVGFFPDLIGKIERIHTPFNKLSESIKKELEKEGINDPSKVVIISDNSFILGNMLEKLHFTNYLFNIDINFLTSKNIKTIVLLWKCNKKSIVLPEKFKKMSSFIIKKRIFTSTYLHSKTHPPYSLAVAVIPVYRVQKHHEEL